jgi:hypothetical protein
MTNGFVVLAAGFTCANTAHDNPPQQLTATNNADVEKDLKMKLHK